MSFRQRFRGRRRNTGMKAPIVSVKNQLSVAQSIQVGAQVVVPAVQVVAVGAPTKILGTEVPVGARVYGIFTTVDIIIPSGSGNTIFEWNMQIIRNGQVAVDTNWSTIGLSMQRNQVFHTEQALVGTEDSGPYKFHRYIKIPKIYQRMREGDEIVVNHKSSTTIASSLVGYRYKYYQ